MNNLFNLIIWIDFIKKNWIEKDQFSTKTHLQKHSLLHNTVFLHKLKSILQRKILLGIFLAWRSSLFHCLWLKQIEVLKSFFFPFKSNKNLVQGWLFNLVYVCHRQQRQLIVVVIPLEKFYSVNSLVVARQLWLTLLSKIV